MKFSVQAELMKNQRHAAVMKPGQHFDAVQTTDGHAVLFSLHDAGNGQSKLYAYREASGNSEAAKHGWQLVDLTPTTSTNVIAFDIAQNPSTLNYDIIVATVDNGSQMVHVSQNNTADSFEAVADHGLPWTTSLSSPLPYPIKNVFAMNLTGDDGSPVQQIYLDALKSQQSTFLARYWLHAEDHTWHEVNLGADYDADKVISFMGQTDAVSQYPGMYTYGTIGGTPQLLFQPRRGWDPNLSPDASPLQFPPSVDLADISTAAVSPTQKDSANTNVWLMTSTQLYMYPPSSQDGSAPPTPVGPVPSSSGPLVDLYKGVSKMIAQVKNNKTVLWCLNGRGLLFYLSCPLGQETVPKSWSRPLPIKSGVDNFAFYVAEEAVPGSKISPNVVFAHTTGVQTGAQMAIMTQNSHTSIWSDNYILLPDPDVTVYHEQPTFTARVCVMDASGIPQINKPVTITPKTPTVAYIDDVYYNLSAGVGIQVQTAHDGSVTIVQNTTSLDAATMTITAISDGSSVTLDPLDNAFKKLDGVKTNSDLDKTYTDERGATQHVVPNGTSSADITQAVTNLKSLSSMRANLQGQKQPTPHLMVRTGMPGNFGSHPVMRSIFDDIGDFFDSVGDAVTGLANLIAEGVNVVVHGITEVAEAAWAFVVNIAGSAFHFVIDSVEKVASAVTFVFNKIKAGIEELIFLLGFLFEWQDFKRTHFVMKGTMEQYLNYAIESIDTIESLADQCVDKAQQAIDGLLNEDISQADNTYSSNTTTHSQPDGIDKPQSHWASHHTKNYLQGKNHPSNAGSPTNANITESTLSEVLSDFKGLFESETDDFVTDLVGFMNKAASDLANLKPKQLLQDAFQFAEKFVFQTVKSGIKFLLKLVRILVTGLVDALKAELEIPIIAPLYKEFVGSELSFLDLGALIAAIPVTIIYKLAHGSAPFPSDSDDTYTRMLKFTRVTMPTTIPGASVTPSPMKAPLRMAKRGASEADSESPSEREMTMLTEMSCIGAFFGGIIIGIVTAVKQANPDDQWPRATLLIVMPCYIAYIGPNIVGAFQSPAAWYNIFNDIVTGLATLKFAVDWLLPSDPAAGSWGKWYSDYGSPFLDAGLNYIWVVPAVGGLVASIEDDNVSASTAIIFDANLFFDFGGYLSPTASEAIAQEAAPMGIAAILTCNFIYAGYMCIGGILIGTGN